MRFAFTILSLSCFQLLAQPVELLKERREALRSSLSNNEIALLISYPVKQQSLDINYEYHANPDIRYLTGISEPGVILLLLPHAISESSGKATELLFVRPKNEADAIWHGARIGKEGATTISGVEAKVLSELKAELKSLKPKSLNLVDVDELIQKDPETKAERKVIGSWISENLISLNKDLQRKIAEAREVKDDWEIEQMRKVINISCEGHKELIRASKNVISEYQMESVIESVFRWNGAQKPAYPSIVGGSANSCVLHYNENSAKLDQGDMVVADVGAEWNGYAADITRSFPVASNFSEEQKLIYNLVLEAQMAGIKECVPGKSFRAPNDAARKVIAEGLIELGLIKSFAESRKYFMHGTSHYLGLDVHDVGTYGDLKAGNIITVEPGIYIAEGSDCDPKWWNIGVRIEDDVLITSTEPDVLSDCVPKEIPIIEKLMQEPSIFDSWKKNKE